MTLSSIFVSITVILGIITTIVVIAGLMVRTCRLKVDKDFSLQLKPNDLTEFPMVSVIIPVRNEEQNIVPCLDSVMKQDYSNLEILVIDDHSSDNTAFLVEDVTKGNSSDLKLELVKLKSNTDLERGEWSYGKSKALWYGAKEAKGDWLLFLDADTRQKPDTIWRSINFARNHNLEALSMSGTIVNKSLFGGLFESMILTVIFLIFPWHRINKVDDDTAWMNGNFILYKRQTYFDIGGHRAVAPFPQEDIALAQHSKKRGVPFRFLPVSSAYECHDYTGLREAFTGWTRRMAVSGERLKIKRSSYFFQAMILLLVANWPLGAVWSRLLGILPEMHVFGFDLGFWAFVHLSLVVLFYGAIRVKMHMSFWAAILLPQAAIIGLGAIFAAYRYRYFRGKAVQKGRALIVSKDDE